MIVGVMIPAFFRSEIFRINALQNQNKINPRMLSCLHRIHGEFADHYA